MDRVAFLYPPEDCTVEEVDLSASAAVEGIYAAISLASPGEALVLPPRGAVGRYAALVAVGDSVDETDRAIADATALAHFAERRCDRCIAPCPWARSWSEAACWQRIWSGGARP